VEAKGHENNSSSKPRIQVRKRLSIQPPSTQQQRRIQKKQQYGKQEAEETAKKKS
jgi:hypothetical protein